jgi:hypothetical protein
MRTKTIFVEKEHFLCKPKNSILLLIGWLLQLNKVKIEGDIT